MSAWGASRCCGAGAQPRVSPGLSGAILPCHRPPPSCNDGWCPQEALRCHLHVHCQAWVLPLSVSLCRLGQGILSEYETGSEEKDGRSAG